ncbi:hypothetical protein [Mesorhizobium sp. 43Arga]
MTSSYCVSFRIANKTINGKSYDDRRQSVVDAAHEGLGYWDETTSFFLVESSLSASGLAKAVSAGLSVQEDMIFVFDIGDQSASYFGALTHFDVLRSFFPLLKKVP